MLEIEKMKVAELRAELSSRGLDVRGTKPILMVRLREAIDKEAEEDNQEEEEETETLTAEKAVVEAVEEDTKETEAMDVEESKKEKEEEEATNNELPDKDTQAEELDATHSESKAEETNEKEVDDAANTDDTEDTKGQEEEESKKEEEAEVSNIEGETEVSNIEEEAEVSNIEEEAEASKKEEEEAESSNREEDEDKERGDAQTEVVEVDGEKEEGGKEVHDEEVSKEAPKQSDEVKSVSKGGSSSSRNASDSRRGQKRKVDDTYVVTEDEPEEDGSCTQVFLDWFNSDLSLKIDRQSRLKAQVMSNRDAWAYAWAGVRATYGFQEGKIMFEVKVVEETECKLANSESNKDNKDNMDFQEVVHELRVGWSTDEPTLTLGETKNSFCYAGSGKKGHESSFESFFSKFGKGDVVTALVDLDDDHVVFSFAKNGKLYDDSAFEIAKNELDGKALFPHISTRNTKFEVNFGGSMEDGSPTFLATYDDEASEALEHYKFPNQTAVENRVRGPERNAKREDCEVIMLVGLPGAGKTTWVNNFVEQHPDKRFNVIGTAPLIDRMKIDGKPRKEVMSNGGWEAVFQKCARSLLEMIKTASTRRRNFIIDQPNVYGPGHRRKIRQFDGMRKKVVFIVPSDEEYKKRLEAQQKEASREIPDNAIMEMKANFVIPSEDDDNPFDEVVFTELDRKEAAEVAETYRKDAQSKGFGKRYDPKNKKQRGFPSKTGRGGNRGRFVGNNSHGGNRGGRMGNRFNSGYRAGNARGGMAPPSGRFMRGGGPSPWGGQSQGFSGGRGGQSVMSGNRGVQNRGGSSNGSSSNQSRGGRGQAKFARNEPRWQQSNNAPWSNSANDSWNQQRSGSGGRWHPGGQRSRGFGGGFDGPGSYDDRGLDRSMGGGPINPWGPSGPRGMGMGPPFGSMGGPEDHYGGGGGPWAGGYDGPGGGPPGRGFGGQGGGYFEGGNQSGAFGGSFGRQGGGQPRWGYNRR